MEADIESAVRTTEVPGVKAMLINFDVHDYVGQKIQRESS